MSFLMGSLAWWVVGAAAVTIPIIIHLLHRQRTQPVLWGAMLFLRMSVLQQKRRKKVDHWLLMLLRLALIALLVLMLAQPLWKNSEFNPLATSAATDIGIVIDHSLSTRRKGPGDLDVYQQAVATLSRLADPSVLRSSDTISVVLAEHNPRAMTPLPVARDALQSTIDRLKKEKPGLSSTSIPEAVQKAREIIGRGRNTRKAIIVMSDGQRSNWKPQDLSSWNAALGQRVKGVEPSIRVFELPIAPAPQVANVSVTGLTITPALIGLNRPAVINADIMNTGSAELKNMSVRLSVNGVQAPQQPLGPLGPGQSRSVRFEHSFTDANSSWVEVKVDAQDGLDADNVAVAGAQVWQVLPILVIDGQSGVGMSDGNNPSTLSNFKSSFYLVNAMLSDARDADSTSLIAPTIVSYSDRRLKDLVERGVRRPGTTAGKPADDLRLESFAAVVVNDVPGLDSSVQNRLNDYARSGHGVWYILGRRTDRTFIRDQLAASNLLHLDVQEQQGASEKPVAIDVKDASHVTLAPFTSADRNVLTGMTTLRWWALKPRDADAQVLLATQTGDPLVMDRPVGSNGGRVMVWTSPVDSTSGWNNWTTLRSFAPMVNVTLYHLASGQTKGQENKRLDSGQPLVWTSPTIRYSGGSTDDSAGTRGNEKPELVFADGTVTPLIRSAEVVLPDGTKSQIRPITRDGRQILRFSDTFLPGKYEVRFDQTALKPVYFGVGIDRRELDETALNDEDRKWFSADDHKFIESSIAAADISVALGGGNKGSQIWPYIAGLLLGILLFETFMTYWMIRRQNGPGVALGVVPAAGV